MCKRVLIFFVDNVNGALDVIYVVLSHSLQRIWQGRGHFLCVQGIELFSLFDELQTVTISIVLEVVHGGIIVNIGDKIHSSIPAIMRRFVMVIWTGWSFKEMRIILEWVKRSEIKRKSCLCDKWTTLFFMPWVSVVNAKIVLIHNGTL